MKPYLMAALMIAALVAAAMVAGGGEPIPAHWSPC
jgi:hypothetical protein